MPEQQYTRITIYSNQGTSYHSEEETAEYSRLEVQVIRQLSEAGVVRGITVAGEGLRYSNDDIVLLRRARRLYQDLGVNLEGVEIILRLQAHIASLQHELEQRNKKSEE